MTVPGTGVEQGDRLPAGARLVYRDVKLSAGQKPMFALRAPSGKALRGLAPGAGRSVGFTVVRPERYAGTRRVVVRAFAAPKRSGKLSGRIYALVR